MLNSNGTFESEFFNATFNSNSILSEYNSTVEGFNFCNIGEFENEVNFYSLVFVYLGFANFFGFFLAQASTGAAGAKLTNHLRSKCFKKYLQLEMEYFDEPNHSTGAITTR